MLIVIPIGTALLLVAISLLFVKRRASGTDWASFFATCLLFTTLVLWSWSFQYGKFLDGHGSYYFSATYGGLLDTALHVVALAVFIVVAWRSRAKS